jgi:hypothetical protein
VPVQPDDNEVEERLREIIERIDPVPGRLLAAALESYTWRNVDSDIAELVLDSVAEDQAALVRGREDVRLLSFEAAGLTIDIQVSSGGQGRRIVGQFAPPGPATVQIRQGSGVADLDADELGRFRGPLRDGPFSLKCSAGEQRIRPVVTDWITI